MASDFVRRMVGETTTASDIAPVMTGSTVISNPAATGAKRRIPTITPEQRKKYRNRVVAGLTGQLKEDRDGEVIPADAKEVQSIDLNDHGLNLKDPEIPGKKIKNPYSGEEPLILPAASLVAPDVTPEAINPIDPTQLPGADRGSKPVAGQPAPQSMPQSSPQAPVQPSQALNVLMGKQTTPEAGAPTTPSMSAESALARLPGIPSASAAGAASGAEVLGASQPMPNHVASDGRSILEAFRKFVLPQPVKFT